VVWVLCDLLDGSQLLADVAVDEALNIFSDYLVDCDLLLSGRFAVRHEIVDVTRL